MLERALTTPSAVELRQGVRWSFDQTDIEAWERDLRDLNKAGEFFSCGIQFLYLARKPA